MFGPRLLVVDDEVGIRRLLERLLEREGWEVITAESAARGLEVLTERPLPECVILDLNLPDGDGVQVLKEIRERLGNLPAVVLSSSSPAEVRARCGTLKVDRILQKPFSTVAVVQTLRDLTGPAVKLRAAEES